jgi:hypothetical protein
MPRGHSARVQINMSFPGRRSDQVGVWIRFTPKARLDFFSDPLAVFVASWRSASFCRARERTAERDRHRVAVCLFREVGIARQKLVKGCHDLAAL